MTYGIISDTHLHNWSAFASVNHNGINTRLLAILSEIKRAAEAVKNAGGNTLYHAGDMFHVRGSLRPSVLNPTLEAFREIKNVIGVQVIAIPGNHDLESKEAQYYMNASTALRDAGVRISTDIFYVHGNVVMVPWHSSVDALKANIETIKQSRRDLLDLIIHAPVNDVIMGIPNHGLDATYLSSLGFNRVFAGHYHNHKDLGGGVYSIGATTHQTWSDVGSKAGFLLVNDSGVKYVASHAPKFIDLDLNMDPIEVPMFVDGHYVRVKMPVDKESEVRQMREFLKKSGAAGVQIHPIRQPKGVERKASVSAGASLSVSVQEFIDQKKVPYVGALKKECESILQEAS